ncbi:uncharacterized protein LY89DRAFT_675493 [Mollisia scopiformis]|uniref:Uncharacterized protein n=1 Tax=Mollisia scopiformis TaxID=149040 RepID=A0A132BE92_MOLSC|nr:uncharacterized protein LY89DRAFT_675493 [Mollisia scopiformis]KUJ09987.1 hypothetical protein LY89DRAFT_675493 [Mollisia scopiformis]
MAYCLGEEFRTTLSRVKTQYNDLPFVGAIPYAVRMLINKFRAGISPHLEKLRRDLAHDLRVVFKSSVDKVFLLHALSESDIKKDIKKGVDDCADSLALCVREQLDKLEKAIINGVFETYMERLEDPFIEWESMFGEEACEVLDKYTNSTSSS